MKKENRKIAQQRRAQERRRKERIRKLKKFLTIAVPCLAAILLIAAIALSSRSSGDDSSSGTTAEDTSGTDTADTSSDETGSTSYSTDTSLTVESGDTVNIDYVGTVDGVEFEGGSTDGAGTDLVIGSGSYIDGFEDQLIGAHPGDTVEVNVTFPEDYGVEDLNGKATGITGRSFPADTV